MHTAPQAAAPLCTHVLRRYVQASHKRQLLLVAQLVPAHQRLEEFRPGVEHRVLDDYERNRQLIDLKAQPTEIKELITNTIRENSYPKNVEQVGMRLLKFCGLFDLVKVSEQAQQYAEPLNAKYPE